MGSAVAAFLLFLNPALRVISTQIQPNSAAGKLVATLEQLSGLLSPVAQSTTTTPPAVAQSMANLDPRYAELYASLPPQPWTEDTIRSWIEQTPSQDTSVE